MVLVVDVVEEKVVVDLVADLVAEVASAVLAVEDSVAQEGSKIKNPAYSAGFSFSSGSTSLKSVMPFSMRMLYQVMSFLM